MRSLTKPNNENYFEKLDLSILEKTKKTHITYKKDTIVQVVLEHFKDEGFSRLETVEMVNNFVEHFKSTLLSSKAIIISGHGRLIPRLKAGGRPVRDLAREQTIEMEETATITFSKTHKCHDGKISSRRLIQEFAQDFDSEFKKQMLAEIVGSTFVTFIHRTRMANCRMEIRGLGVFRSTKVKAREGRNPKTGKSTYIPESTYPRFKISAPFRRELTEKLRASDI